MKQNKYSIENLVFLKLGGSLITDKDSPNTPKDLIISQVIDEISVALSENPKLKLLIGHGSGSFGHFTAKQNRFGTGISDPSNWMGFVQVCQAARNLNQIVLSAFFDKEIDAITFPPSVMIHAKNRKIISWNLEGIKECITHRIIPIIYGDVIFDEQLGGVIFSTEYLFEYLARKLKPDRILIAGIEPGVWSDYPNNSKLLTTIESKSFDQNSIYLGESKSIDVTGGMGTKVTSIVNTIKENPGMKAQIFSGTEKGNILQALFDKHIGTIIT